MFTKLLRFCFFSGLIIAVTGVFGYFSAKVYFTDIAEKKAAEIIKSAQKTNPETPDQELIEITRIVFDRFEHKWPSEVPLLRFRPYISSRKLPEFIKFPEGVIDTIIQAGMCDNAVRMLHFVLKQKGYESVQWNMVTDRAAHSALLVFVHGERRALLDPFYGYAGYDKEKGRLLPPDEIHTALLDGKKVDDAFLPLSKKTKRSFYKDFRSVRMAAITRNLDITATLPHIDNGPLLLGKINGDGDDILKAAGEQGMTPFWNYAGHKYDRSWVRILKASQDVRLEIILTANVENGVITSDPRPQIEGNKMIWDLKAVDEIKFHDGKGKISWKRLNSYIDIDQIAIYPN